MNLSISLVRGFKNATLYNLGCHGLSSGKINRTEKAQWFDVFCGSSVIDRRSFSLIFWILYSLGLLFKNKHGMYFRILNIFTGKTVRESTL